MSINSTRCPTIQEINETYSWIRFEVSPSRELYEIVAKEYNRLNSTIIEIKERLRQMRAETPKPDPIRRKLVVSQLLQTRDDAKTVRASKDYYSSRRLRICKVKQQNDAARAGHKGARLCDSTIYLALRNKPYPPCANYQSR